MVKHFAIAFAVVGIFASMAYCTVEESRARKDERLFRAEFCGKQGGRWTDGWFGSAYCDFSGAS